MGIEMYESLLREMIKSDEYLKDLFLELIRLEDTRCEFEKNHIGCPSGLLRRIFEMEESIYESIGLIPLIELFVHDIEDEKKKDDIVKFFTSEKIMHTTFCDLRIDPKTLRIFQKQYDVVNYFYDTYGPDSLSLIEKAYELGYMEDIMFSSTYTDYYLTNMAEDIAFKSLFEIFSIYEGDVNSRVNTINEYMDPDNRVYVDEILKNPNLTGVINRHSIILSPKKAAELKETTYENNM